MYKLIFMKKINLVKGAAFIIAVASSFLTMAFKPFDTPHHQTGTPLSCQAVSLPAGCGLSGSFTCKGANSETIYQKNDCTVEYKRITP